MRVSTYTKNGVTNIELIGDSEKDIAVLTDIFNQSSINRSFRFRARPVKVIKDGEVSAVVLNNDAYITRKYLVATGFYYFGNTVGTNSEIKGSYFVKDNVVLYNRNNSNVYVLYSNAKLEHYVNLQTNKPEFRLVQVDTSKPLLREGSIRKVSELDKLL